VTLEEGGKGSRQKASQQKFRRPLLDVPPIGFDFETACVEQGMKRVSTPLLGRSEQATSRMLHERGEGVP
jgi:hypothetical protein